MGVRGLFSFFENSHDDFFVQKDVSDTLLVIDGNNLRYHLYHTSPKHNCSFGGDYNKYYNHVKRFFEKLISCKIKPIVVIDGSYENAKRKTLWQRTRDQIQAGLHCTPHNSIVVLPLMAKEVFLRAVNEFCEAILIQDFHEADSKIALLSSVLKCPVLSNDSDFFVFNVDVIPLRSLNFQNQEREEKQLRCQMFDRELFLKHFGIRNPEMLFLLASLMGNDYVSGNTFERVFSQIRLPKKKSQCPRHRKMTGLLYWLSREKDIDSALVRLLNAIPFKERDTLRSKLEVAIKMYKLDSFDNIDLNDLNNDAPVTDILDKLFSDNELENILHKHFLNGYKRCLFPSWLLDIILHQQIYLPCQVEDKEHPSSQYFAEHLLQATCELVLSCTEGRKNMEECSMIKTISREGNKCRSKILKCNTSHILNSLTLGDIDKRSGDNFLFRTFNIPEDCHEVIRNCDNDLKLLFICIHFWCSRQKDTALLSPQKCEFAAVIAMISIYKWNTADKITLSNHKEENIKRLYIQSSDLKSNRKLFNIATVQSFANLQTTVMYGIILNRLLDFPMEEPPIHLMWNSTILYNAANMFSEISELQSYLELKEFDNYMQLCDLLIPNYNELKSKVVLAKRKRPKRYQRTQKALDELDCAPEVVDKVEDNDTTIVEYEDVANKFSILSMI